MSKLDSLWTGNTPSTTNVAEVCFLIELFSKLLIFKNVLQVNLSVLDTSDCNTY